MNKYVMVILILAILVTAVYVGINDVYTQHYDDGEISFDYPQSWMINPGSNPSEVVLFQPGSDVNVTVNKQVIPAGYQHPQDFILNTTDAVNSGFRLLSHQVINRDGNTVYENNYFVNSNGSIYLRKEIWQTRNGNLYSMIYTHQLASSKLSLADQLKKELMNIDPGAAETENNNGEIDLSKLNLKSSFEEYVTRPGFEATARNFKVNSVLKPAKTPFWGAVSIPAINTSWGIRSDTVNGYNSTYHYNESFYPSQNGTMGLLGHHTLYSAPFAKIDRLKPGDQVIIADYLTQKKYIYRVVSNGDIKWDYQTNPIKFPNGSTDLTLVTCYPPGTTNAAWMVHCKLSFIELL